MTYYGIIGPSGEILYQSTSEGPLAEETHIQFLPLLLVKDLIKDSLQDRIRYMRIGKRTMAMLERDSLLFIACADKRASVGLLLKHLGYLHRYLLFTHGRAILGLSHHQTACLSQLAFHCPCPHASLCHVEQMEIHQDLRHHLTSALRDACHDAFSSKRSRFSHTHRIESLSREWRWTHAFLFVATTLVTHCANDNTNRLGPRDLYCLLCLLNEYPSHSRQSSRRGSCSSVSAGTPARALPIASESQAASIASSPALYVGSSSSGMPSLHSSSSPALTRSNITPPSPFKIRQKSSPSHFVSPPLATSVLLSSPPRFAYSRFLTQLVEAKDPSYRLYKPRSWSIAQSHSSVLSSSVPSESKSLRPMDSDSSSPIMGSPSQSVGTGGHPSPKGSFGRLSSDDDIYGMTGNVYRRWFALGDNDDGETPRTVLVLPLEQGLHGIVLVERQKTSSPFNSAQVSSLQEILREHLQDYAAFLVTKASAHFTVLSFSLSYPGLIHFVHIQNNFFTAPRLVDLNVQDKDHECLLGFHGHYGISAPKVWPCLAQLKSLTTDMIQGGLPWLESISPRQVSSTLDPHITFVYQRGHRGATLMAMYFTMVPSDKLRTMHSQLLQDVTQRQSFDVNTAK